MFFCTSTGFFFFRKNSFIWWLHGMTLWPIITSWLVVSTPLKNISQLGSLFPIYGKIKNGNQTTNQPIITRLFCVKHFSAKTLDAYRGTGVSSVASGGATPKLFPIDLGVQKKRLSQKTPKHVRFMRFTSKKKSVNEIDNQKKRFMGFIGFTIQQKKIERSGFHGIYHRLTTFFNMAVVVPFFVGVSCWSVPWESLDP